MHSITIKPQIGVGIYFLIGTIDLPLQQQSGPQQDARADSCQVDENEDIHLIDDHFREKHRARAGAIFTHRANANQSHRRKLSCSQGCRLPVATHRRPVIVQ